MGALWIALAAIGVTLANLYLDIYKPLIADIWGQNDPFWWKVRASFIGAFVCIWDTLKAAYKKGLFDIVISILIKIIKNKLGIPTAAKRVGKALKK